MKQTAIIALIAAGMLLTAFVIVPVIGMAVMVNSGTTMFNDVVKEIHKR